MLSKEELLRPRYKVIANYPGTRYKIGMILKYDDGMQNFDTPNKFSLYPAIFEQIHWWQYRIKEDMPSFLKYPSGNIYKVTEWVITDDGDDTYFHYENDEKGIGRHPATSYPVTEEEFIMSINTKNIIQ